MRRVAAGQSPRIERVDLTESVLGGSRLLGEIRPPARDGMPWVVGLHGPLLDLRQILAPVPPGAAVPSAASPPAATPREPDPPVQADLRFDRVMLGDGRILNQVVGRARTDAQGLLREARVTGRTGGPAAPPGRRAAADPATPPPGQETAEPGPGANRGAPAPGLARPNQAAPPPAVAPNHAFEASLIPNGDQRLLRLTAEDAGALLHALDLVSSVEGGQLDVTANYAELRPGAPLTGTARLDNFSVRDAPGVGKLLQALTLYGMVEALQGGRGLVFSQLVAPFTLTPDWLALTDARAFSASLGLTAKGHIYRNRPEIDLEGTIVPAYMLNTLLGRLPLVGRLFSPETGGGLFAATYRLRGAIEDPEVTVNPLAALTPGFLRGVFGLAEGRGAQSGPPLPTDRDPSAGRP